MPARRPIIPGFTGPRQLLRAIHTEMREKKVLPDNSSTSSGIHSNSDVSDTSDLTRNNKRVEFVISNQDRNSREMGRSKTRGGGYFYGSDRADKEDASSSSGPDDDMDDDDVSDNNDDACQDNEDFDESNDSESDDDDVYDEEKEARETDDRIAWEHKHDRPGPKFERYAETQKMPNQTGRTASALVPSHGVAVSNRRQSGPTSYVRLVKETEDEIELIRRKQGHVKLRQRQLQNHPLTAEEKKQIMAKRRSTNSITFMYGRRKDGIVMQAENTQHNSTNAEMLRQIKARTTSLNPRSQEVENHMRRIQGNRNGIQLQAKQYRSSTMTSGPVMRLTNARPTRDENNRPLPAPRAIRRADSDSSVIDFPLKELAAGTGDSAIGMRQAKTMERVAKQKTKALKNDIGLAKLDVAEAKIGEFSVTLRARQAKIEERHAKLCRRRAALKKAEEDLDSLESKMDDEEEEHRARERRIKNRERRVRQEEAGIRLKEESLRKREGNVSEGIDKIEQRRKIVEEKEEVQKAMDEIMTKKEELHGRDMTASMKAKGGIIGKMMKKRKESSSLKMSTTSSSGRSISSREYSGQHGGKQSSSGSSLSTYESKERNHNKQTQNSRENSQNQSSVINSNTTQVDLKSGNENNLKRTNGKSSVMGLWI